MVFHRILDFKNGAGYLSGPLLCFIEMRPHDPRFRRPDDPRKLFLAHLAYPVHRTELLEQLIRSPLADPFDLFQLIGERPLASFLTMERNTETMHLIAYPADQLQTVAVIRKPDGFRIARKEQLFFILGEAYHGHHARQS